MRRMPLGWCAIAVTLVAAHPDAAAKPSKAEAAELQALEQELTRDQLAQAYFAAVKVARKLYSLERRIYGEDARPTESRKRVLAAMLNGAGDYDQALVLYQEILRAAEKDKGPGSREALAALSPIVGVYWAQNRVDDLEPLEQRMLATTKALDGERSLAYAEQLSQYGTFLITRNEYAAAQQIYEQSLAIHEALAPNKMAYDLLSPTLSLAHLYWQTNQRPKAMAFYDRVIGLADAAPNGTVMLRASMRYSVASIYHYGGRDDLAAPLTKRVIALYGDEIARLEKTSPDDYQITSMLGQLGFVYLNTNDLPAAEKEFSRAIEIGARRRTGPRFTGWESTLADVKRALGKPREALALYEKGQAAMAQMSPRNATMYNLPMADVLRELGERKRAEALVEAHRVAVAATYGKHHPYYGQALLSASYLEMGSGKVARAEQLLGEGLDIAERELALALSTGTESDHATYFSRNGYQLDAAINFHRLYGPTRASAARLALTTLLRRKGRVLDASAAALATIRARLSPEDKKLLDQLASARAQLAKLTVAGPSATGDADYAKEIAALEDKVQALELEVGKKSAAYKAVKQPIELGAVQKAIPRDARLVEIVSFQVSDPAKTFQWVGRPMTPPVRRYAAYVVGHDGDPALVDLGPVEPIDEAVAKFRRAVSDPDNDRAVELGRALHDLTMAKIAPRLGSATNVLIAPDGALNLIPFSALVDPSGSFLIKRFTFTYLTSGRDLLRLNLRSKAQGGGMVFADPAFDSSGPPVPAPADGGVPATRGRRSADLATITWSRLPGTAEEAAAVARTMRGLQVFRGDEATETRLKEVHGPRILHLATHGFFLSDEQPRDESARAAPAPGPGMAGAAAPGYENPLLRAGLALAGANKLSSGNDDGVLTAMEASGLDLWGTKLVVLSACETGVGKVTNGDGVYGLRRALVIAGAEGLVTTLWQVDDEATRDLMSGYYARLANGKARSSALRDVQLAIQARPKYAHPYYWASFLPAGADTPLED
jgi:CHAT domain-containing protein